MLVHASPKEEDLCETVCSLNFATRARSVHLGNTDSTVSTCVNLFFICLLYIELGPLRDLSFTLLLAKRQTVDLTYYQDLFHGQIISRSKFTIMLCKVIAYKRYTVQYIMTS